MFGGWHAGASPSDPLSRLVTNRGPRSRPFAHTYTPPGSSSDFDVDPAQDQGRAEDRVWSRDFFQRVRSLHEQARSPIRCAPGSNLNSNSPFSCLPVLAPHATPGPHVWIANFTLSARSCAQEASLTSNLSIQNGLTSLTCVKAWVVCGTCRVSVWYS